MAERKGEKPDVGVSFSRAVEWKAPVSSAEEIGTLGTHVPSGEAEDFAGWEAEGGALGDEE